jgi:YHS domain-containing protein
VKRNISLTTRATSAALALALLAAPAAHATPLVGVADEMAAHALSGLALGGFDPVSFHLGVTPRPGRADLDHVWSGAAWRFASEANRAAFLRDPWVYAPRLGGHDAEAAARGVLVDADPAIFTVREGRLYLFRNREGRARFKTEPALFDSAEARWHDLRRDLIAP